MTHYNPLDKFYKSTIGAVCEDEIITFRVKGDFTECSFCYKADGEDGIKIIVPMSKKRDFFETEISFSRGLFWYFFKVGTDKYIGIGEDYTGVVSDSVQGFQLSVYSKDFSTPDWLKGGIIYQIFPDRFNRGVKEKTIENGKILRSDIDGLPFFKPNTEGKVLNNDFFGGDFKGIEEKLNYLEMLGVTAIYLNPVFKAYSNHRYDTGDYLSFDPLLGTEDDFKSLVSSAKEKGIRIILDGVFNHTGDDSVYFNKYGKYDSVGAYQSKNSKYAKWYKFIDYPDEYESWWGISILPALDKTNPDFIDFITGDKGVLRKYTELCIGGWRLDVVDELPDGFVKKIRKAVKTADPDAVVIGEVWEDATNKISYGARRKYFLGEELDSVMNYPLKDAIIDFVLNGNSKRLSFVIKEQSDHYPAFALNSLMNILSTHDTYRLLSAVGGIDVLGKSKEEMSAIKIPENKIADAIFRHKAAVLLQYTLCGVPSVYYGDEIGMQGYSDPLNRAYFKWNDINEELLSFYKKLGKIRKEYSVFVSGEIEILYDNKGMLAYKRSDGNSEIFVAVNFGEDAELRYEGELKDVLSGEYSCGKMALKSKSFVLLINDK